MEWFALELLVKLQPLALGECSKVVLKLQLDASEEWRHGDIGNIGLVAAKECVVAREALLDNLKDILKWVSDSPLEDKGKERGQQLAANKLDEEAHLGPFDRGGWHQPRLGVEIRDKFEEHSRFSKFDRLIRWFVGIR